MEALSWMCAYMRDEGFKTSSIEVPTFVEEEEVDVRMEEILEVDLEV